MLTSFLQFRSTGDSGIVRVCPAFVSALMNEKDTHYGYEESFIVLVCLRARR